MSPIPSITFQLRADKIREDGSAPIRLRAHFEGRSAYFSTGVRCRPSHWNKKKSRVKGSAPLAATHNRRLGDIYAQAVAASYESRTSAEVIAALTGGGASFSAYAQATAEKMKAYGQRMKTAAVMRKVHAVLGEPVSWRALTPEALRKIEKFMREELGNSANTSLLELGRIRALVNRAIRDGVLKPGDSPFVRYQMPRRVPTKRRRLTIDELLKIADLDLEVGTPRRVARDVFLIATFGGGVRISDVLLLGEKSINGNRLEYRAQKTKKLHNLELPPRALAVLKPYRKALHERMMRPPNTRPSPYIFPLLKPGDDSNEENVRRRQSAATTKMNRILKEVALLADLEPEGFSTHCSRHTFADIARQHGDLHTLKGLLGHSDISTTQRYVAELDHEKGDQLTRSMWGDAGV